MRSQIQTVSYCMCVCVFSLPIADIAMLNAQSPKLNASRTEFWIGKRMWDSMEYGALHLNHELKFSFISRFASFSFVFFVFLKKKNRNKIEHNNEIHARNGNDEVLIILSELQIGCTCYLRYRSCAYRSTYLYLLVYRALVQSDKIKSKEYDLIVDRYIYFKWSLAIAIEIEIEIANVKQS